MRWGFKDYHCLKILYPLLILLSSYRLILCKELFYLLVNVLCCVAEFLIENFIRCREAETWHSKHFTVGTNESFESYRQTSCHTENLTACRQNALLVFFALRTEQTFTWSTYDTDLDTILT